MLPHFRIQSPTLHAGFITPVCLPCSFNYQNVCNPADVPMGVIPGAEVDAGNDWGTTNPVMRQSTYGRERAMSLGASRDIVVIAYELPIRPLPNRETPLSRHKQMR